MRAIAGAIVFLAGVVMWGFGNLAENQPPHSNATFAMSFGLATIAVGVVLMVRGWNDGGRSL